MVKVKVVKISDPITITTKFGEKEKIIYTCLDDKGNTFETSKFHNINDLDVEAGQEVLMELVTEGKYINCKRIEPIEPAPEPPKEIKNGVPESVWVQKDLEMARMNALTQANKFVENCLHMGLAEEWKALTPDEFMMKVEFIAQFFVNFIKAKK